MLKLVRPGAAHEAAVMDYLNAFRESGEGFHGMGWLEQYDDYTAWLNWLEREAVADALAPNLVPATTYLALEQSGGQLVGMANIRHRLNDALLRYGGHIGYSVHPGARRKGYGTEILRLALEQCAALGIDRALISCSKANEASRRVILSAGGVLESEVMFEGRPGERYWTPVPHVAQDAETCHKGVCIDEDN